MAESKTTNSLAAKLAAIGKRIGAVDKSGTNREQKYNFIEYGVVAGRIRELFDEYQVIIVPNVESYQVDEIKSKYGSVGYHYTLNMKFKIINGEDPTDNFEATWMGESADYGDKGINKAETSGTKYFLMRLFNVSEKGEEEADAKTIEIGGTKKRGQSPMEDEEYSAEEIVQAKAALATATSLDDLKSIYVRIGKVRSCPEVIEAKDDMKKKLASSDPDVAMANAKEAIEKQFGGGK